MYKSSPGDTGFEGLKGSQREVEAWNYVAGPESLKRAHKELLVKMQPSFSRDPSIVEIPVPWDASQAQP